LSTPDVVGDFLAPEEGRAPADGEHLHALAVHRTDVTPLPLRGFFVQVEEEGPLPVVIDVFCRHLSSS